MSTKKRKTVSEDAFGTPPAARGSMMNVAGKTDDEMEPGEELLVDDGEAMGPTEGDGDYGNDKSMNGPVYPSEGKTVKLTLGELRRLVRTRIG